MKRLLILMAVGCVSIATMAQTIQRVGVYKNNGGETVFSQPQSEVAVVLRVEQRSFTPGELARYAQKYLGVRASLASRTECEIIAADIVSASQKVAPSVISEPKCVAPSSLPSFRTDGRVMTQEQQASAAADMIFSLRRHRMELITGEAGEYVFGAGLQSALDEIARLESELLALFYGKEHSTIVEHRFEITPTADNRDYVLCRYRDDAGIVPVSDLSGEVVMLHFEPSPANVSYIPVADEKVKVRHVYAVPAQCCCTLLCGLREVADAMLDVYQYGSQVEIAPIK